MTDSVLIKSRASLTDLHAIEAAEFINPNEKLRLIEAAAGLKMYPVMVSGQGHAKVCRRDCCQNFALAGARKQLCPTHYANFLERSNRERAKPRCVSCSIHTSREFHGKPMCLKCFEEEQDRRARANAQQELLNIKHTELQEASTVDDLKLWIERYVL